MVRPGGALHEPQSTPAGGSSTLTLAPLVPDHGAGVEGGRDVRSVAGLSDGEDLVTGVRWIRDVLVRFHHQPTRFRPLRGVGQLCTVMDPSYRRTSRCYVVPGVHGQN